jgi:2OG-Fe(II) oxygenase superfamily
VRIEWSDAFETILDAVRDEFRLPSCCELAADFHAMLVYEPGQFFVAHQDSEKDDTMIGTLVVTLPSAHTGVALVIGHGGGATTYRGPKFALSLVAFYADCRHEVLPVKSGYRITLTYNLLLRGDTSGPITGDDGCVSELARRLDEHFITRVTNPYSRADTDPPNRLVYLLDHEYTARGLSWSRLKGTDASRASLLRAAADRDRPEWLASLPGLCEALHAKGSPGTATAHRLLDLSWDWLGETIRQWLATQSPSHRDKQLGDLGQPLAAVLTAAAVTGAVSLRDEVVGFGRQQGDEVIACVMPALRAAGTLPADMRLRRMPSCWCCARRWRCCGWSAGDDGLPCRRVSSHFPEPSLVASGDPGGRVADCGIKVCARHRHTGRPVRGFAPAPAAAIARCMPVRGQPAQAR